VGDELSLPFGLLLAFGSAGLLSTSFFFQHRSSNRVGELRLRHPFVAARALCANPVWLLASGGGAVGWACYIAALHYAPLSLVQGIGSGGLGLLTLLAHRLGSPLSAHDRHAGIISTFGVVLLCSSLAVAPTSVRPHLYLVIGIVLGGLITAGVLAGSGRTSGRHGIALGAAAGVLYSMSDIATKGALEGLGLVLLPLILTCTVLGFVALQIAFQRDAVLATAGLSSLVNTVVPIAAGIVIFREALPSGIAGWARGVGFILSIVGGVLLSQSGHRSTGSSGEASRYPSLD
jgi:hypothetical protein